MSMLYLVEIHDDDFEYDEFVSGVVWADTAAQAKDIMRKLSANEGGPSEHQKARLKARRAKTHGVVHTHWHAG